MFLEVGEKVHVIERRMFDSDVRRHFFGEVQGVAESAMRIVGYVFVYDASTSTYVRGKELRTRIIPLTAPGYVINVAPPQTYVEDVRYTDSNGRLVVTDGGDFSLDINEFGRHR